jgi:hypothetical protein
MQVWKFVKRVVLDLYSIKAPNEYLKKIPEDLQEIYNTKYTKGRSQELLASGSYYLYTVSRL